MLDKRINRERALQLGVLRDKVRRAKGMRVLWCYEAAERGEVDERGEGGVVRLRSYEGEGACAERLVGRGGVAVLGCGFAHGWLVDWLVGRSVGGGG